MIEDFKVWLGTGYNPWYLLAGASIVIGFIGWLL